MKKETVRDSRMLRISDACLYLDMQDGETLEEAVERLLEKLDEAGVYLSLWKEEVVEEE